MVCGRDEWQLFMTDEEVAEWEALVKTEQEVRQQIGKIRRRCNRRRKRFNKSS